MFISKEEYRELCAELNRTRKELKKERVTQLAYERALNKALKDKRITYETYNDLIVMVDESMDELFEIYDL